jgi:LmbE family N-acetylglucosaminyl deacetylase
MDYIGSQDIPLDLPGKGTPFMNKCKLTFFRVLSSVVFLSMLLFHSSLRGQILVLSPHPDDDVITSSGNIYRAVQDGKTVKVVFMTNGDLYGGYNPGYQREGEAVTAESYLGVGENNLIFLGYPDGGLQTIYNSYTSLNDQYLSPNNISKTYANRGLGSTDYHSYRFGAPASYNRPNILEDLEDIINTYLPSQIFVTSEFDAHSDHSTTYQLLKLALAAIHNSNPSYAPVINKTIVHWEVISNPAWPNTGDPATYVSEMPNLTAQTGLAWTDRESLDVPLPMQSQNYASNPKCQAVASHASQGGTTGFLGQFLHKDEIFWVESPFGTDHPPIVNAGLDQTATVGQVVYLDGSLSRDPDGDPLSFHWVQKSGSSVQLQNPATSSPNFTAPVSVPQNNTLSFELVISDGVYTSVPDSVSVIVQGTQPSQINIAPLATVTASSQNTQTGQTAAKAVDGVIDGYPGDYTREWATVGQKAGAWLKLAWSAPYTVSSVILYDRPNLNDNITGATLTFSDGSSVAVGPLNNDGTGVTVNFPAKVTTSIIMTVTSVSSTTSNIGLAEIQAYGTPASQTQYSLVVNANPSGSGSVSVNPNQSSYAPGQQVTLTATANTGFAFGSWSGDATGTANPFTLTVNANMTVNANFAPLAGNLTVTPSGPLNAVGAPGGPFTPSSLGYTLQNSGNTTINWSASATQSWVTLSSTGGSLSPGASTTVTISINSNAASLATGSYSDTLTLTNLSNGSGSTTRAVSLTISQQQAVNIAPLATVTASSQNTQTGQTAAKAVDGVIDGYPGDYTREWATVGQKAGAWLKLAWSAPYTVSSVILYDRPNLNDNITGATLTFSDGSSVAVGPLNNDGTGVTVNFPAKVTTSIIMTVTSVSSTTINIGLAEIQVFGN